MFPSWSDLRIEWVKLPCTVCVEAAESHHQPNTAEEDGDRRHGEPANRELQAPAVDCGRDRDEEEKGQDPTVQPVLRDADAVAFDDVPLDGNVGPFTAEGGADEEACARSEVEETRHKGRGEMEPGVDEGTGRRQEGIHGPAEETAGDILRKRFWSGVTDSRKRLATGEDVQ